MRVVVSAEVTEEVNEILGVLAAVDRGVEVTVVAPAHVVFDPPPGLVVHRIVARHAPYGAAGAKVIGVIDFLRVVRRQRPALIVSGFSLLKHRLAAAVFRVPHVAYLRGLLFDAAVRSGFSDRIASLPVIGRAVGELSNAYSADLVLTVGPMNGEFLRARAVPAQRVVLVGPLWLRATGRATVGDGRTFLLSSALAAHGHVEAHRAQVEAFAAVVASDPEAFVIRVHPRDQYDYEADARFFGTAIDRASPYDFLATLRAADRIMSPRSTFAFECLFLGAQVTLFHAPGVPWDSKSDWLPEFPLDADLAERPVLSRDTIDRVFSTIEIDAAAQAVRDLLDRRG